MKSTRKQSEAGPWTAFADTLLTGARSTRLSVQAESLCRALGAVCPPRSQRVVLQDGAQVAEYALGPPVAADDAELSLVAGDARLCWMGAAVDRDLATEALAEAAERLRPLLAAWATLRRESATDPLTGAGNRRALDEHLATTLSLYARHNHPVSVLMLDADRFKDINDREGHAAGDRALTALAAWIRGTIRAADRLYRYGGDEFVLVLPHTDADGARQLAQRVRAGAPISVSIAAATAGTGDTPASLLHRVDQALLEAKRRLTSLR